MPKTAVKERPILFSPPMVSAILAGRKTITRRIVELGIPQDADNVFYWSETTGLRERGWDVAAFGLYARKNKWPNGYLRFLGACPFGDIGDRLWVQEAFKACGASDPHIEYKAGGMAFQGDERCYAALANLTWDAVEHHFNTGNLAPEPWQHAKRLPRWACRLTLEITGIKVERLNAISEADAIAEGIERVSSLGILRACGYRDYSGQTPGFLNPVESFRTLWESIHGPGSWERNEWVWAISFRRIED